MFFGMPTLVELPDLAATVREAAAQGLDFVEINMSFPQYTAARLNADEARALAEKYGIFYTIHADEALNPFDFNPKVAQCYFGVMRDTIRTARAIGAKIVNLHLQKGVYVTLPDQVVLLTDVYRDEYLANVRAFVSMCEEEIGGSGVRVAIENVDSNPFTEAQIAAFPIFFASPVFALTLDTGHEHCLGGKDAFAYREYPDRLVHMHLHDSDGRHAHLPLGRGSVPLAEKLSLLPENATCLIEVKTVAGLTESLAYAASHRLFTLNRKKENPYAG